MTWTNACRIVLPLLHFLSSHSHSCPFLLRGWALGWGIMRKNCPENENEKKGNEEGEEEKRRPQILCLPRTMRQALVRVKNRIPPEKKKDVVYEVQCSKCDEVYVGETGRTLKKRISEHKQGVKRCDQKNVIAVYMMNKGHTINWEEASVKTSEMGYWKRRVQEAIRIQRLPNTMNLDHGMILSNVWTPALKLC